MDSKINNDTIGNPKVEVTKKEKSLIEIFQLIVKNKYILITCIFGILSITLIYAFTTELRFEATAVLKKESNPEDR